jgi:hypothetical protein
MHGEGRIVGYRSYEQLVSAANARTQSTTIVLTTKGMKLANMAVVVTEAGYFGNFNRALRLPSVQI